MGFTDGRTENKLCTSIGVRRVCLHLPGSPHREHRLPGQTCLDLNINLNSNLLLKAAHFYLMGGKWVTYVCPCSPSSHCGMMEPQLLPGIPVMKMQGHRNQVESGLIFQMAL